MREAVLANEATQMAKVAEEKAKADNEVRWRRGSGSRIEGEGKGQRGSG
jgi:hypothetical protein